MIVYDFCLLPAYFCYSHTHKRVLKPSTIHEPMCALEITSSDHLHLVWRLRMCGALHPLPPTRLHPVVLIEDKFTATLTQSAHKWRRDNLGHCALHTAATRHGRAQINYTAEKLRAQFQLQHVKKPGINNCTGFYCPSGISLKSDCSLTSAGRFHNSSQTAAIAVCLHLLVHIAQQPSTTFAVAWCILIFRRLRHYHFRTTRSIRSGLTCEKQDLSSWRNI
jgi:hypothetical protein